MLHALISHTMIMLDNTPILRKHKLKYLGVTPSSGSDQMCVCVCVRVRERDTSDTVDTVREQRI